MSDAGARETWEARYRESDRIWSGNPNHQLVEVVAELSPGTALDLGCGEGADAIWLARQGWRVTALDVSATALARAAREAERAGVPEGSIRWQEQDLTTWRPGETFDLVSAFFLHSPIELPRAEILRRAAAAVAEGGHLLVVGHASEPPWAAARHSHEGDGEAHQREFPTAREQLAELELPADEWEVRIAETRPREAIAPDGERVDLDDVVVLVRRLSTV